ncbi:MAG TPA: hypothetical protein P5137_03730 [Candidatus Brocadiia bacterium]|nr:hypothetical protein [Candidatus Brocadiia bacterium]
MPPLLENQAEPPPPPRFYLLPAATLPQRIALALFAMAVGAFIQFRVFCWWAGAPFVLIGSLLFLCRGVTNRPAGATGREWQTVNLDQFRHAVALSDRVRTWKRDPFSLTSGLGCFTFFVIAAALAGLVFWLAGAGCIYDNAVYSLLADAACLFVPLYLTGRRSAWEPESLRMKIEPLLHVGEWIESGALKSVELAPMLETALIGGQRYPLDAKLMIKLGGAPDAFIGVQAQVSINDVRGMKFPYLYCVLLAKPGAGMIAKAKPFITKSEEKLGFFADANDKKNPDLRKPRYKGEVAEASAKEDVEIIVIRQVTLRKGYHTPPDSQIRVTAAALELAGRIWLS